MNWSIEEFPNPGDAPRDTARFTYVIGVFDSIPRYLKGRCRRSHRSTICGSWPSQPDLNGTTPSVGVYANNVTVDTGMIRITYGGPQVNLAINNQTLTLVPYTNDNGDVLWQCGLAPQYLPSSCNS